MTGFAAAAAAAKPAMCWYHATTLLLVSILCNAVLATGNAAKEYSYRVPYTNAKQRDEQCTVYDSRMSASL